MPPISISYLQSRSKTKKDNQLAATKLTSIYRISMNKSQSQAKHSKTHFKHKSVILSLPPLCWFLSVEVDFKGQTVWPKPQFLYGPKSPIQLHGQRLPNFHVLLVHFKRSSNHNVCMTHRNISIHDIEEKEKLSSIFPLIFKMEMLAGFSNQALGFEAM